MTPDEIHAEIVRKPEAEWTPLERAFVVERARRPAVMLVPTEKPDDPGAPGCWLSGKPTLPAEIPWPHFMHNGEIFEDVPLHFFAQLNLAHVPWLASCPEMPRTGTLFFFADMVFPHNGPYPGCAKVIYVDDDVSQCAPRDMPPVTFADMKAVRSGWQHRGPLPPRWNLSFLVYDTFTEQHSCTVIANGESLENNVRLTGVDYYHYFLGSETLGFPEDINSEMILLLFISQSGDRVVDTVLGDLIFWIERRHLIEKDFSHVLTTEI
ncbi:MAG: DUF1963 domain-containing protein [Pseudomonadota bacterium]